MKEHATQPTPTVGNEPHGTSAHTRSPSLVPGRVLSGRFIVEGRASDRLIRARDNKTGKAIALHVLEGSYTREADRDLLKGRCQHAAQTRHPGFVATYGLGLDDDTYFVAREWMDDPTLVEIPRDEALSLETICAVAQTLADALSAAGELHGAIHPGIVHVGLAMGSAGASARLGDFGSALARIQVLGVQGFTAAEQACLAPEIKGGRAPDSRADVFGIGTVVYYMLTRRLPAEGFTPPSQLHPEATAELDSTLLKALATHPDDRYNDAQELVRHLRAHATDTMTKDSSAPRNISQGDGEDGDPLAIDIALSSGPPTAASQHPGLSHLDDIEVDVALASLDPGPSAAAQAPAIPPTAAPGFPVTNAEEVDLKKLVESLTEDDTPRWMVVVDGVDLGPFSPGALIDRILKQQARADSELFDIDFPDDTRCLLGDHPEYRHFVEQAHLKAAVQQEQAALESAERGEKRGNVAKIVIGVGAALAVAAAATAFIINREAADEEEVADVELGHLYQAGEIEVSGTAQLLDVEPPRRGGGARGGGRQGVPGTNGAPPRARNGQPMTYEQAMAQPVDLGDVSNGGGEQQLTAATVQGVMNRHINALYQCAVAELQRGGSLSTVRIHLAIAGDGRVLGANPTQGSGAFQGCIQSRVQAIRFPTFSAPRMGASFTFHVD